MTLPRLRALEILHVDDDQGRPAFLFRDPLGYSSEEVILSEAALFAASYLDGKHTLESLQANFTKRYNTELDTDQINALLEQLDTAYFLENDTFDIQKSQVEKHFFSASKREPAHGGVSYPLEKDECLKTVTGFFEAGAKLRGDKPYPSGTLTGLVAPHIDLRVGGPCTALAYQALSQAGQAKTVVVLGTSHACAEPLVAVTEKDYQTPLGPVATDVHLARKLSVAADAPAEAELFHFKEHSIEFQAVFLAALRSSGKNLNMVPVLCGSIRDTSAETRRHTFWDALEEEVNKDPGRVVVIAAADLAHVGPRFGDEKLDKQHLELLEKKDRDTLAIVEQGDPDAFFDAVMMSDDPRRICGLSPIYGMLNSMPKNTTGELMRYEQASDESGTVTYASMSFWR